MQLPAEANSHITVLVDLSATWLNERSKEANQRELKAVSTTVAALAPSLKAPIEIQYLEIGDGSLSRQPLCSARFVPSIFPSTNANEFSELKKLDQYFGEDCSRLILMRSPEKFTDITGALNTVSRISSLQKPGFNAVLVLSDFQEERRANQTGVIGSLKGIRALLLYRVLEADRFNPTKLDARMEGWLSKLRKSGAAVVAVDDVSLEPAQLKRLLNK